MICRIVHPLHLDNLDNRRRPYYEVYKAEICKNRRYIRRCNQHSKFETLLTFKITSINLWYIYLYLYVNTYVGMSGHIDVGTFLYNSCLYLYFFYINICFPFFVHFMLKFLHIFRSPMRIIPPLGMETKLLWINVILFGSIQLKCRSRWSKITNRNLHNIWGRHK